MACRRGSNTSSPRPEDGRGVDRTAWNPKWSVLERRVPQGGYSYYDKAVWTSTGRPFATAPPSPTSSTRSTTHSSSWTSSPDADPPKTLVIGSDPAGNLLERILLELADDDLLAIHAMPPCPKFHDLFP